MRDRIVAETGGNPLALLQLPRGLGPAELAGGFWLPDPRPLASRIETSFLRQFRALPRQTQRLLLTAAAEPTGDVTLLWRAAGLQGIPDDAAAAAEDAGLIELGGRVRFVHPLVRSAVYQVASAGDRRAAHRALAEATDPDADADRRAWHLAHAAPRPDEPVAAELERSAGRAQARGGLAAAAAFLERAAALTPDPARRAARALAAAAAKVQAGAFEAAGRLLGMAEAGPLDESQRARADLLRARLTFAANRGNDAPPLLLKAAKRLEPIDAGLARGTYLDALTAAHVRLPPGQSRRKLPEVSAGSARRTAAVAPPARARSAPGRVCRVLHRGVRGGSSHPAAGAERLRPGDVRGGGASLAVAGLRRGQPSVGLRPVGQVFPSAPQLTREAGAFSELPGALGMRAHVLFFAGELAAAASLVEEVQVAAEATGMRLAPYGALGLAAFRGREAETAALASAAKEEVAVRGEGNGIGIADWATALLSNGLGRYDRALAAAEQASAYPAEVSTANWGLVELIEAAARAGSPERGTARDASGSRSPPVSAAPTGRSGSKRGHGPC